MRNKANVNMFTQDRETGAIELVSFAHSTQTSVNSLSIHDVTKVTRKTSKLSITGTKVTTILVHTPTGIIEIDCFNKDTKEEA